MRISVPVAIAAMAAATLAAVAVPNLRDALDRTKQKQTMAGLRDWGIALQKLQSRHLRQSKAVTGSSLDLAALAEKLKLPLVDGWGHPYRITMTARSYFIQAAARDGVFERITTRAVTNGYDRDLAFANGEFIRYPEGI